MKKISEVSIGEVLTELSSADMNLNNIKAIIALAIAKKRLSDGLTQKEFAKKLGVSQSLVARWENGSHNFTIESLNIIASKLDFNFSVEFSDKNNCWVAAEILSFPAKNNWGNNSICVG